MKRREFIQSGGIALVATTVGCFGTSQQDAARSPTTTEPCNPPPVENLVDLLPPPPSNLSRSVDPDASQAYLDEYKAVAAVSAEYTDGDDAVLDDSTVRVFRFREDAAGRQVIINQLNSIEFDSGRVGVGVVVGRLGFIAAAPRRARARSLLTQSPAVSSQCLERRKLLPSKTRTPATGEETHRQTETNT